jgi:hypothetical protein
MRVAALRALWPLLGCEAQQRTQALTFVAKTQESKVTFRGTRGILAAAPLKFLTQKSEYFFTFAKI